jgi:hypothetical protein
VTRHVQVIAGHPFVAAIGRPSGQSQVVTMKRRFSNGSSAPHGGACIGAC